MNKEAVLRHLNFASFYQGELVELKKGRGDEVLALCPFHEDNNPSLSINLETGVYHCFGCGAKGDVFTFYMQRYGVDFKTALAELGSRAGVSEARPKQKQEFQNLTLAEFSLQKRLPLDFLKQHQVQQYQFPDGAIAVDFRYLDQDGKLLAIRHRFGNRGDKKFRWRKGDKIYPYGLWKLPFIRDQGWLLLVEGETDCLTCWLYDVPALGLPGKKTWKRCWETLRKLPDIQDLQVYLWQEPDAVELPQEVAKDLPGVLVIQAPAEYKDLSEAHCQGWEVDKVVAGWRDKAKPPEPPAPPPVITGGFTLSNWGNAKRMVALHGHDLRYCNLSKKWYYWTGQYWSVDNCGEVERRAKAAVMDIYREASEAEDEKERMRLAQFALRSESTQSLLAIVRCAQSEPGIQVQPQDFNADPFLFNCANGTIDLRTGQLRPPRREDLITTMAPVAYDPEAPCDLWEKFLFQIMDYKQRPDTAWRYVQFLQQALGYSLTGDCREECLFILWGGGANGKSTMVNTVSDLLGEYARNTPMESLLSRPRGGEIPADIARLDGPRFVTSSEVDRGRRLAESLVKALTGRDTITARYLYGEFFDFKPQFKLWLSTNNKPVIKGTDDAIWRRIMFIRFPVHIPKEERDLDLRHKLLAEGPGILAWMVRGCLDWQSRGLDVPPEVIADIAEYRNEMDILAEFLEDRCILNPSAIATASDLYEAYVDWANEAGIREKDQLKQKTFGTCLSEHGFIRDKGAKGQRIWRGVGLRDV